MVLVEPVVPIKCLTVLDQDWITWVPESWWDVKYGQCVTEGNFVRSLLV